MTAIVKERIIAATPEKIFNSLTKPDEIACWWTDDLSVKPEVGSLAEFRFAGGTFVVELEIAELDTNKKVFWISKKGYGFEGTTINWQLTPVENRTKLVFTQDGFAQGDQVYEQDNATWEYFLASLKSYQETGKGTPGFPENFFG